VLSQVRIEIERIVKSERGRTYGYVRMVVKVRVLKRVKRYLAKSVWVVVAKMGISDKVTSGSGD
jgi:3-deoxy-D-manno-octulosonic acid (KDO) 8-phosphate synthase